MNRIVRIWIGPRADWLDRADATWAGFEVVHLGMDDMREHLPADVLDGVLESKGDIDWRHRGRMLSDLLRYTVVSKIGGLYTDSDVEFIGSDPGDVWRHFNSDRPMLCMPRRPGESKHGCVNQCVLGALSEKAKAFWADIFHMGCERVRELLNGPGLWHNGAAVGHKTGPAWLRNEGFVRHCHVVGWPVVSQFGHATDETIMVACFGKADHAARARYHAKQDRRGAKA